MAKRTIKDVDLKDKKVLVHVDFNVPSKDGVITNDNHIVMASPTTKYVTENGRKAILFSHLGRVKTGEDKAGKLLKPVIERLSELLGQPITFVPETRGKELEDAVNSMKDGDVLIFESIRFKDIDDKKESDNNAELGKHWASLGDVFINDALDTAHRTHASNVGTVSTDTPTVAGFLTEKEIKLIGETVEDPERPLVAILNSAEVPDKIIVIGNLVEKADKILIGGGTAYTFMRAQGYSVGLSLPGEDKMDLAKSLMERAGDKLVLPVDTVASKELSNDAPFHAVPSAEIPNDEEDLDIDEKIIELSANELQGARTVVWNGPMGVFKISNFARGTIDVCEAIANLEDATTIIGGGDSAAAAIRLSYESKFSHVSTGGGASLELLEGKTLPDLAFISDKQSI